MSTLASFLGASKRRAFFLLAALALANALLFSSLGAAYTDASGAIVHFLDVGQGDAAFVELPGGVQILIDGGPPNGRLLQKLSEVMPPSDRTIDLVVMTHPELDHYGGFIELLERYRVGAFLETGVTKDVDAYAALQATLAEQKVRRVALRAGDRVRYRGHVFTVLSPDEWTVLSKEPNDTSMVLAFETEGVRFLFTGDISAKVERLLAGVITEPFDVLKVAHHGSKFSSAAEFLTAVRPTLAAIGVGKNSYGHPTKEALGRLASVGARVYRTDRDGTVTVRVEDNSVRVFSAKGGSASGGDEQK
ncbi:MAG: MBL fold metallo-hydrolase [Candidatus Jorgensenbacteria bacterium]|nr:MBL fold metallo-hydrolase [Candidatus Jorgensenbacteria bacterium]